MNANRKKQVGLLLIVIVIAVLLVPLGQAAAEKIVVERNSPFKYEVARYRPNPPVIPPHANAYGKTYGEWGAEWWQWALALPADENHPLIDDDDVDCSMGQEGKVWFLGGTYAAGPDPGNPTIILGEAHRTCEVPVGKALYFPIVNIICSDMWPDPPGPDGTTGEELSGCANFVVDNFVYPLSTTIDGMEVDDLEAYRTVSPPFEVDPLPALNLLELEPGTEGLAVTSGYYLLLPPMSRGEHTIAFEAEIIVPDGDDPDEEVDYHFVLDISYDLTVVND